MPCDVGEPQVVEIFRALHYGVPQSGLGTQNLTNQSTSALLISAANDINSDIQRRKGFDKVRMPTTEAGTRGTSSSLEKIIQQTRVGQPHQWQPYRSPYLITRTQHRPCAQLSKANDEHSSMGARCYSRRPKECVHPCGKKKKKKEKTAEASSTTQACTFGERVADADQTDGGTITQSGPRHAWELGKRRLAQSVFAPFCVCVYCA